MNTKNKIYLLISVVSFFGILIKMMTSYGNNPVLDENMSLEWMLLWVVILILPIFNLAEIIIHREDKNLFYWIGLVFNILSILFLIKYYKIEIFAGLFE